jgi:hypothetical protein
LTEETAYGALFGSSLGEKKTKVMHLLSLTWWRCSIRWSNRLGSTRLGPTGRSGSDKKECSTVLLFSVMCHFF